MSDRELRITLKLGDVTLELRGDADAVRAEFAEIKASGIGKVANLFALAGATPAAGTGVPTKTPLPATSPSRSCAEAAS